MKPVEIAPDIYWVGAVDWNIRDFHGYLTKEGTTYNAFLVMDDKITLVDTVKREFVGDLIAKISHIVDPKRIDYVISNHTEMDHSGGLPDVMKKIGEDKPIYCSKKGFENLSHHFYHNRFNYQAVDDGGELSIGKRTLTFLETRMLHWPDSMFTYDRNDKILFCSDAFGQHYASLERFDDEIEEDIMPHAKKYFANILLVYAPLILKLLEKVQKLGLEFNIICPDHGIMWRRDINEIIEAYVEWSEQKPKKKALVIYDTMWHSTEMMAEAIIAGISEQGVAAKPINIRKSHRSDIMTELMDAGAVIVGSPTLNNGLFPTVIDVLTYIKGLKPKNKICAAFGSYGWSGEAVKLINREFEEMKLDIIDPGINIQFVPDEGGLEACRVLGRKIGEALSNRSK
ncbi:MAG: FprA family A-type flavoprotein [Spirochaetota bacterium]|nr:FprA family A-type flavoprotein [Spirochaetota bacterium]